MCTPLPGYRDLTREMFPRSGHREELREQERKARAMMQSLNADFEAASPYRGSPLFDEPIKANEEDELTRRIRDSLGDFRAVEQQVNSAYSAGLIGVDQMPPTPRVPDAIHDPDAEGDADADTGADQPTTHDASKRFHDSGGQGPVRDGNFAVPRHRPMPPLRSTMGPPPPPSTVRPFVQPSYPKSQHPQAPGSARFPPPPPPPSRALPERVNGFLPPEPRAGAASRRLQSSQHQGPPGPTQLKRPRESLAISASQGDETADERAVNDILSEMKELPSTPLTGIAPTPMRSPPAPLHDLAFLEPPVTPLPSFMMTPLHPPVEEPNLPSPPRPPQVPAQPPPPRLPDHHQPQRQTKPLEPRKQLRRSSVDLGLSEDSEDEDNSLKQTKAMREDAPRIHLSEPIVKATLSQPPLPSNVDRSPGRSSIGERSLPDLLSGPERPCIEHENPANEVETMRLSQSWSLCAFLGDDSKITGDKSTPASDASPRAMSILPMLSPIQSPVPVQPRVRRGATPRRGRRPASVRASADEGKPVPSPRRSSRISTESPFSSPVVVSQDRVRRKQRRTRGALNKTASSRRAVGQECSSENEEEGEQVDGEEEEEQVDNVSLRLGKKVVPLCESSLIAEEEEEEEEDQEEKGRGGKRERALLQRRRRIPSASVTPVLSAKRRLEVSRSDSEEEQEAPPPSPPPLVLNTRRATRQSTTCGAAARVRVAARPLIDGVEQRAGGTSPWLRPSQHRQHQEQEQLCAGLAPVRSQLPGKSANRGGNAVLSSPSGGGSSDGYPGAPGSEGNVAVSASSSSSSDESKLGQAKMSHIAKLFRSRVHRERSDSRNTRPTENEDSDAKSRLMDGGAESSRPRLPSPPSSSDDEDDRSRRRKRMTKKRAEPVPAPVPTRPRSRSRSRVGRRQGTGLKSSDSESGSSGGGKALVPTMSSPNSNEESMPTKSGALPEQPPPPPTAMVLPLPAGSRVDPGPLRFQGDGCNHGPSLSPISTNTEKSEKNDSSEDGAQGLTIRRSKRSGKEDIAPEIAAVPPLPTSPLSPLSSSTASDSDSSASSTSTSSSSSSSSVSSKSSASHASSSNSSSSASSSSSSSSSSASSSSKRALSLSEARGKGKLEPEAREDEEEHGSFRRELEVVLPQHQEPVASPGDGACVGLIGSDGGERNVASSPFASDGGTSDRGVTNPRHQRAVAAKAVAPAGRRKKVKVARTRRTERNLLGTVADTSDEAEEGEVVPVGRDKKGVPDESQAGKKRARGRPRRQRSAGSGIDSLGVQAEAEDVEMGEESKSERLPCQDEPKVAPRRSTRRRTITGATNTTSSTLATNTTTTTQGSGDSDDSDVKVRKKRRKKAGRDGSRKAASPPGKVNRNRVAPTTSPIATEEKNTAGVVDLGSDDEDHTVSSRRGPPKPPSPSLAPPAAASAADTDERKEPRRTVSRADSRSSVRVISDTEDHGDNLKRKRTPALSVEPKRRRGDDLASTFDGAARAVSASPRLAPAALADALAAEKLRGTRASAGLIRPRPPPQQSSPRTLIDATGPMHLAASTTTTTTTTTTTAAVVPTLSRGFRVSAHDWIRLASLMMPPSELGTISPEAVTERPQIRVLPVPGSTSRIVVAYVTMCDYRVPDLRTAIPLESVRRRPRPPVELWIEERVRAGLVDLVAATAREFDPVDGLLKRELPCEEAVRTRLQAHWDFQQLRIRASDEQKRLEARYELGLEKRRPVPVPWDQQVIDAGSTIGGALASVPLSFPALPHRQNRGLLPPLQGVASLLRLGASPPGLGFALISVNGQYRSVPTADVLRMRGIVRLLWIAIDSSRVRLRCRAHMAGLRGDPLGLQFATFSAPRPPPSAMRDWLSSSSSSSSRNGPLVTGIAHHYGSANRQDSRWKTSDARSNAVFESSRLNGDVGSRAATTSLPYALGQQRSAPNQEEEEQRLHTQEESKVFDAEGRQTTHYEADQEEEAEAERDEGNGPEPDEEEGEDEEVDTKPLARLPPYETLRRGSGSQLPLVPPFSSIDESGGAMSFSSRGESPGGSPAVHGRRHRSRSRSVEWDPLSAEYAPGSLIVPPPRPRNFGYYEMKRLREMTHPWEPTSEEDANAKNCMFLREAKRLKHLADAQKERNRQAMTYLEAIMYFILTAFTMEKIPGTEKAAYKMYQDTLTLIESRSISGQASNRLCSGKTPATGTLDPRLSIICVRCRSLLNVKLFQMRRAEANELIPIVDEHFSKTPIAESVSALCKTASLLCSGSSPLSPNPSPASSVGSQSSGYSSGNGGLAIVGPDVATRWTFNDANSSFTVLISAAAQYGLIQLQNVVKAVVQGHNLWDQADEMVEKENTIPFFSDLEQVVGPLTIHSTIKELVYFVQAGLRLMQARLIEEMNLRGDRRKLDS